MNNIHNFSQLLEKMHIAYRAAESALSELNQFHYEDVNWIHEHFGFDEKSIDRLAEFFTCIEGVARRGKLIL
ncbi:MAG: hypothetical protein KDB27_18280 [Planctomycetales bacterium]|nr:hypothetical protein [Planctomycetales bacterium]